jgi:hypothetical protein
MGQDLNPRPPEYATIAPDVVPVFSSDVLYLEYWQRRWEQAKKEGQRAKDETSAITMSKK